MDCWVVVEAAVPVYDVETTDEAIRIAISKTGEMLNPDLNYVEISMSNRQSPSGEELPPAFVAADEALVALELEMTVFNVEREEHASRIARKEIGQRLENIPLKVLRVDVLEEENGEGGDPRDDTSQSVNGRSESERSRTQDTEVDSEVERTSAEEERTSTNDDQAQTNDDADLLPEFEEMVEDEK